MRSGCGVRSGKKDEAGTREIRKALWSQKAERKTLFKGAAGEKGFRKRREKVQQHFRMGCCLVWDVTFLYQYRFAHEKDFS